MKVGTGKTGAYRALALLNSHSVQCSSFHQQPTTSDRMCRTGNRTGELQNAGRDTLPTGCKYSQLNMIHTLYAAIVNALDNCPKHTRNRYEQKYNQDYMSVCFITPNTPLLYSKIVVYRGIHNFLIFALKHRLWVLVRTASLRRFQRVPTIYVLSKNEKIINFFI